MQEFDEPHQQFFELLGLWFIRTLHEPTNLDFAPLRVTFTHARDPGLREVHRLFRCPVEFAQAVDSRALLQRILDLPIVSGDSYPLRVLTVYADELLPRGTRLPACRASWQTSSSACFPVANHGLRRSRGGSI